MSLIIKNQRIYDFYQSHPQYDFEKMNIFLMELLENFHEKMVPSLDHNFASQIMSQMVQLQTQLLKQQQEQQLEHYKQLNDHRKTYNDELKNIIQSNHNEQIAPLLSQQANSIVDKIEKNKNENDLFQKLDERFHQTLTSSQSLTTNLLSSTESRLQESLKEQNNKLQLMVSQTGNQEAINNQVSDLLRKMDNSSSKGKVSETMLHNVLHNLYPMGDISSVATTKETGDFIMAREGKPKILFENKNYDKNVGQDEVQKFLRDVDTQKCAGILCAQNHGIANKSNYEIHLYQGQVCLYLHQVQYSPEKLKVAVDIIDHLSHYIKNEEFQVDSIAVDKDFLDMINKEYQHFAEMKTAQMKTIKEYSQKMLSQLEDMKMPQLDSWLMKYFSQSFVKENECKYCGFEAKSSGGLTSHMRSCVAKKNAENLPIKPVKPNPFTYS